jgi:hypothetical protein
VKLSSNRENRDHYSYPNRVNRRSGIRLLNLTVLEGENLRLKAQGLLLAVLIFFVIVYAGSDNLAHTANACLIIDVSATLLLWAAIDKYPPLKLPGLLIFALVCFGLVILKSVFSLLPIYPTAFTTGWMTPPVHASLTLDFPLTVLACERLAALGGLLSMGWIIGAFPLARRTYFQCLMGFAAAYAIIAIVNHDLHPNLDMFGRPKAIHYGRLVASLENANAAGALLGIFGCISFAKLIERLQTLKLDFLDLASLLDTVTRRCAWPAGCLSAVCAALALTASRGGLLATLMGFSVVFIVMVMCGADRAREGNRQRLIWTGAALIFFAVITFAGLSRLEDRAVEIADEPNRIALISFYLKWAIKSPLTGFGLGTFPLINIHLINTSNFKDIGALNSPHNLVALWLFEDGPAGLFLRFMSLIATCLFLIKIAIITTNSRSRIYLAAGLGASALLAQHNIFDFSAEYMPISGLWINLLGLSCANALKDQPNRDRIA